MNRSCSSCSSSSNSSSSGRRSPHTNLLRVRNLTGNVNRNHLFEIFENFGEVRAVDLPEEEAKYGLVKRNFATVEMTCEREAYAAKKCMDRGWVDGNVVRVDFVDRKAPHRRYGRGRHRSPYWRRRRHRSRSSSR